MKKVKLKSNKKVIIPVVVVCLLIILAAIGIYFITSGTNEEKALDTSPNEEKAENIVPSSEQNLINSTNDDIDEEAAKEETENSSTEITNNTENKVSESINDNIYSDNNDTITGGQADDNISSNDNSSSNSGQSSAQPHSHTWVDHTASKQVWVSNIVTVPDYETQTIYGARFYTMNSDGSMTANGPTYWFENGFTKDDLKAIIRNGIKNADENGLYNGVYYGNYQNVTKTEQVQVGSHEEDQGYYEEQSYIDYQYCAVCGERR